jgi:cytochrome c-type biogenesis protein CcmH
VRAVAGSGPDAAGGGGFQGSAGPGGRTLLGPLVLAGALVAAAVALAVVAVRGPAAPRSLDDRVRAVAATLRCPVCQNLSVADSPSRLAQEMRRTIARDLRAGLTPDQIRARFVAAYGQWILQAPPKRGIGLAAWVAPALLMVAGVGVAGWALRRWTVGGPAPGPPAPALNEEDRRLLERALAEAPAEGPE